MRLLRPRLQLEALEDRLVLSISTSYGSDGSVSLNGAPRGEIDVIHTPGTSSTKFTITDNGSLLGTYNILNNLNITTPYRMADIKIDLGGGTIPGSVTLNLGSGYVGSASSAVYLYDDSGSTPVGRIGGNVSILGGNGHETYEVGTALEPAPPGPLTLTPEPILISGNLTASASLSSGALGNALTVDAGTRVAGSLSASLISNVTIGSATTATALTNVGLGATINDNGSLRHLSATVYGVIGGNLSVYGTVLDDNFALQQATSGGGLVKGALTVNLYGGQTAGDRTTLGTNTQVNQNATLTDLNSQGTEQFNIYGSVLQSLSIQMGSTANSVNFTEANLGDPAPFVGGSMTITAAATGLGSTSLNLAPLGTSTNIPTIIKDLNITLGNGDNGSLANPNLIAVNLGGTLNWQSGNGMNFVQLGNNASSGATFNYTVNMVFGSDDDYLAIDLGASGFLAGKADGGGAVTQNTYNPISGTPVAPTVIVNFS